MAQRYGSTLPEISPAVVDAITDMLLADQGMQRPPERSAAMLALICELYERKLAFPRREDVAKALNASVSTIDAALSTRLSEGYITVVIETTQGNVARRNSAIRERFYIPSDQLRRVVAAAKRRRR